MLSIPREKISQKALTVWRIYGALFTLASLIPVGISVYFVFWAEKISVWFFIGSIALALLIAIFAIYVIPTLRYKRWRYEIRGEDLLIQKGLFIKTQTLIPLIRVQHVDTMQGPILRKFHLASVEISTAATQHEIPALEEAEAETLRQWISNWIKAENRND